MRITGNAGPGTGKPTLQRTAVPSEPEMALPPIRIILVDDHAVVREGVRAMVEVDDDLLVVGGFDSGDAALVPSRHGETGVVTIFKPQQSRTWNHAFAIARALPVAVIAGSGRTGRPRHRG